MAYYGGFLGAFLGWLKRAAHGFRPGSWGAGRSGFAVLPFLRLGSLLHISGGGRIRLVLFLETDPGEVGRNTNGS